MRTALILHPELGNPWPPAVPLVDERMAMKLGAAYDNGAYMVAERVALRLSVAGDYMAARRAIGRALLPSYAELRNYLEHECDVPHVLAARVALRLTTLVEVRGG